MAGKKEKKKDLKEKHAQLELEHSELQSKLNDPDHDSEQ